MEEYILALDLGGSKIAAGLVNREGKIFKYKKWSLPKTYDKDYIIGALYENVSTILDKGYRIVGAGAAIPAVTDAKKGLWVYAPYSGIADFPIAEDLSVKLNVPVFVENDVNACAIGERRYGCCRDATDFLWITISNGIGGGLFLNGNIYYGTAGFSGEIGHITVEETNGLLCGCGKTGCLEAEASGPAISRKYNHRYNTSLSAEEIAAFNDARTEEAFYAAGFYVGKAISHTANLLNIKKVVIGGGVSGSFELLLPGIRAAVDKYLFSQANRDIVIEKTSLGYNAGLLGAAAVGWNNIKGSSGQGLRESRIGDYLC